MFRHRQFSSPSTPVPSTLTSEAGEQAGSGPLCVPEAGLGCPSPPLASAGPYPVAVSLPARLPSPPLYKFSGSPLHRK